MRNPRFWLLLALFFLCAVLHYVDLLPFCQASISSVLGLERHSVERVLFLALIASGGLAFGLGGGLVCLGLALATMLPRVLVLSPYFADALFETPAVLAVRGGGLWWVESHRREVGSRTQALQECESGIAESSLGIDDAEAGGGPPGAPKTPQAVTAVTTAIAGHETVSRCTTGGGDSEGTNDHVMYMAMWFSATGIEEVVYSGTIAFTVTN